MSNPYVGEIRMFGGSFAPAGWAFCDGQLLPISENDVLFQLIGTTYGGDGQETFALPDLRGRLPLHMGQGPGTSSRVIGELGGSESVTLTTSQMPNHTHPANAATSGNSTTPGNAIWANVTNGARYKANTAGDVSMNPLPPTGGNQPHENRMPILTISFIISLFGIFPTPF